MKVLVIGRGLSALGVLWALRDKDELSINWVGPKKDRDFNCSLHSTALVARQGIKRGLSPLGDLLSDSYDAAVSFIGEEKPEGVTKIKRTHFAFTKEQQEKMARRFESDPLQTQHEEEGYIFHPKTFLGWWQQQILKKSHVVDHDDWIHSMGDLLAIGCKGEYSFDICFDCRGSSLKDYNSLKDNFKKVPGHYLVWKSPKISESLKESSWVKTIDGHNLIYHHREDSLVLGGSTEKSEVSAPAFSQLALQLSSFKEFLLGFDDLHMEEAQLLTGLRTKASKRLPYFKDLGKGHHVIGGYYKNGYSLCFGHSMRVVSEIF